MAEMQRKLLRAFMGAIENNDSTSVENHLKDGIEKDVPITDTVRDSLVGNMFHAVYTRPLIEAVKSGSEDVVDLLLEKKANVNLTDDWHNTPLHYAVAAKNIRLVTKLLDKGADMNMQNKSNETAVYWAKYLQQDDILQLFWDRIAAKNKKRKKSPKKAT